MTMLVQYGTVGGVAVVAVENAGNYDHRINVTLTATYIRSLPAGYEAGLIDPNSTGTGLSPQGTGAPGTFSSGVVLNLFPAEAAALVAGG
jgi:hypothetical protein